MFSDDAIELGERAARQLAALGGIRIGPGLTEAEFSHVEQQYGFEFADDHRAFLAAGLPLNTPIPKVEGVFHTHAEPWPDWRDGEPEQLRRALDWPAEGVVFDVEHNNRWHEDWGGRPADPAEAVEAAKAHLAKVPTMVPVYGHRYLPAGRGTHGHPVLSIYQTDMICYGADLVDCIHQEFGGPGLSRSDPGWNPVVTVPFWSDFV
jgi:hypothetical protein